MFKTLFTVSMFFCLNAQSIELFGYKLYEDILRYENDGRIKLKKGNIESISIKEDNVLIANKYLTEYTLKSTKTGNIYEIHGSNNQLQLSPVECLDIQDSFINSFQKKNTELFQTEVKQFPNKLKSKTTWEIYLSNKSNSSELIFSVTCDYSFNNRRMDIILTDSAYLSNENSNYENLLDENKENIIEQLSIKRMGMPEDIANMVSFLCKDESEYITGQVIPIDGGLTT